METIKWKKRKISIVFENKKFIFDVWPVFIPTKKYEFTVWDKKNKTYIGNGFANTEKEACDKALLIVNL